MIVYTVILLSIVATTLYFQIYVLHPEEYNRRNAIMSAEIVYYNDALSNKICYTMMDHSYQKYAFCGYKSGCYLGHGEVDEAKSAADKFVRRQFKSARAYLEKGKIKAAYWTLGVALHAIQDATSPVHAGFQVWSGEESLGEQIAHVKEEMTYPGMNSNLQKATNWFLDQFESGKDLPTVNIFDLKIIKSDK